MLLNKLLTLPGFNIPTCGSLLNIYIMKLFLTVFLLELDLGGSNIAFIYMPGLLLVTTEKLRAKRDKSHFIQNTTKCKDKNRVIFDFFWILEFSLSSYLGV